MEATCEHEELFLVKLESRRILVISFGKRPLKIPWNIIRKENLPVIMEARSGGRWLIRWLRLSLVVEVWCGFLFAFSAAAAGGCRSTSSPMTASIFSVAGALCCPVVLDPLFGWLGLASSELHSFWFLVPAENYIGKPWGFVYLAIDSEHAISKWCGGQSRLDGYARLISGWPWFRRNSCLRLVQLSSDAPVLRLYQRVNGFYRFRTSCVHQFCVHMR